MPRLRGALTLCGVISSDKVGGTSVYTAAGDKLGSVDHLMIDTRSTRNPDKCATPFLSPAGS